VSASDQHAAAPGPRDPTAALGTSQLLRRYWQPRHWSAWLFILWLKVTALLPWRATVALHHERRAGHRGEHLLVTGPRTIGRRDRMTHDRERVGRLDGGEERAHASAEAATDQRDPVVFRT